MMSAGRHLGDGCDLFDRIVLHARFQLVEAVHPLGDEVLVVDALVDDDVEHAERQRAVGAGPELQVMRGAAGRPGIARIDRDDLRAALHAVDDPVPVEGVGTAVRRILAPGDDHLGRHPLRIVVAPLQELRAVDHAEIAHDRLHGAEPRRVAGLAGEAELAPVGAAEAVGEERDRPADIAAGALREDHRFGAVLLADFLQPPLAGVEGLVPADRLEFAFAARAHALERPRDAVGVVHVLLEREHARARAALVPGIVLVALDAHELAVLDEKLLPAAAVAAGARRPGDGRKNLCLSHRPALRWSLRQ